MSKKDVYVLFSGGLDSTYLLWKNLEEGNNVYPVYINIENNKAKSKIEKKQIDEIYENLRKKYSNLNRVEEILDVSIKSGSANIFFQQLPIWMLGIIYLSPHYANEIQIGYVGKDDIIPYINYRSKVELICK